MTSHGVELSLYVSLLSFSVITTYLEPFFTFISACKLFEFQCDNSRCISGSSVCDDVADCDDYTDEYSCGNLNINPMK